MRLVIMAALLASPVTAQDNRSTFSVPAGCTAYLTVQDTSCTVDHHYICEADPEGHQRRVSMSEEGITYAGVIDAETQWISSFRPLAGYSTQLEADPAERASFSNLIANGVDEFDFIIESEVLGPIRYVGSDRLTGSTVTIDDITIEETAFEITAYNAAGDEQWSSTGTEFISREWRMFLSGADVVTTPIETYENDDTPVEFIFPGERGFLSTNPKYGCGIAISFAPLLQEYLHDNL